jgi:hypothetical protein
MPELRRRVGTPRWLWNCIPRFRTICLWTTGLCALAVLTAISFIVYILFTTVLPMRRAYLMEMDYLYAIGYGDFTDILTSTNKTTNPKPPPPRPRGLIQDVPQLHYWSVPTSFEYDEVLGIHFDGIGSGDRKGSEFCIYFGGTSSSNSANDNGQPDDDDPTVYRHRYKAHSCVDPAPICNMYNSAFDRVASRFNALTITRTGPSPRQRTFLRYVDCDVTPLICDSLLGFNTGSVLLVHMKISDEDCDNLSYPGVERCPVTWRFLSLPMWHAPWTRQIRIPLDGGGSTIVPAFPDAEEQMWRFISQEGSELGLEYVPETNAKVVNNSIIRVRPNGVNSPKTSHGRHMGIDNWGMVRSLILSDFGWKREVWLRCYAERWLDIVLKWWDGPPYVAKPRNCVDIEAKVEEQRMKMQARDDFLRKYDLDYNNVFTE